MKAIRNVAFLITLVGLLLGREGALGAALLTDYSFYTFYSCDDGCTCTPSENGNNVTIDCPEVAPSEECSSAWAAADEYCTLDLEWQKVQYYALYYNQCVFVTGCTLIENSFDGCTPESLEPPTNIGFSCGGCYIVEC